ncbi:hypothetical protein [Streptomyces sp. JH34]|uniref:hypothetical protein n=1 Tax=Streptomyces sp. JH34 TaxID=2793633 RepID=UPI0023FA1CF9|nr:hypothetical protein [Streptomyces sp. JH34]MDF6021425.1 hypothetical protein [Streptomyces sp. JH34]
MRATRRGTTVVAVGAAGLMTMTAGCGLVGESASAPATPSPEPTLPFTTGLVADEIAGFARAGGLPPGDTSATGLPDGDWRTCVAPWKGYAPAADSAGAFEATVTRLRQHDWEIVSSHAEGDVTYRTLAKRGWKLYARYRAEESAGATVSLTAVEDSCRLPGEIRGDYEDPV